jgi:hypothetical protein
MAEQFGPLEIVETVTDYLERAVKPLINQLQDHGRRIRELEVALQVKDMGERLEALEKAVDARKITKGVLNGFARSDEGRQ